MWEAWVGLGQIERERKNIEVSKKAKVKIPIYYIDILKQKGYVSENIWFLKKLR